MYATILGGPPQLLHTSGSRLAPSTCGKDVAHVRCFLVLTEQQVRALLDAFDRATPLGLRGYAFTLCLVRLRLRAGEVARLCLGDIDWRAGSLRIAAGKGGARGSPGLARGSKSRPRERMPCATPRPLTRYAEARA